VNSDGDALGNSDTNQMVVSAARLIRDDSS